METIKNVINYLNQNFTKELWFWLGVIVLLEVIDIAIWIKTDFITCTVWGLVLSVCGWIAMGIRFNSITKPITGKWIFDIQK